jgi:CRISPR-associated protein Cmr6
VAGRRTIDVKETRIRFLENVAKAVDQVMSGSAAPYVAWHSRYEAALRGIGVAGFQGSGATGTLVEASTVWRLVVGLGTNPALETGLQLHPLLGFPLIPGSAVRGLVHHVAELALMEKRISWMEEEPRALLLRQSAQADQFLVECETVWTLFGSLNLERHRMKDGNATAKEREVDDCASLVPPRDLLERWRKALATKAESEPDPRLKRIARLLDETTGGRLVFYDAVPRPGQAGLLQTDIINAHYPEYYQGEQPPSDDQNPNPVYFLVVRPKAVFEFPFRWRCFRGDFAEAHGERAEGLAKVGAWLRKALEDWGAGGKTAAGYGYFAATSSAAGSDRG